MTIGSASNFSLVGQNAASIRVGSQTKNVGKVGSLVRFVTVSSSILRRLDALGVDHSLNKNGKYCSTNPVVFSHKTVGGECKLESGIYISDPNGGDGFGEFRFYSGIGTKKYQCPECNILSFDSGSLEALKDTYHKVRGVTEFLRDFLDLSPCRDLEGYELSPECFAYFSAQSSNSNGFLIFPNLPYINFQSYTENRISLKELKSGLTLGAWAIHPNQNLPLIENIRGEGFDGGMFFERKTDHTDNNRTLYEIEADTGVKYLSSILDLDVSDVSMLEKLREDTVNHLVKVYGVEPEVDKIKLFFHFPIAEKTATLHLHVWVNKADHPLNNARSFELDDIVESLRAGETIAEMILQRNGGRYYVPVTDQIGDIQGIPNLGRTKNPFIMKLG